MGNAAISDNNIKKEVIMPGRDQTGPMGQGPLTGRGLGRCSGNENFTNSRFGRGRGFRMRGRGFGFRGGFAYDELDPGKNETLEDEIQRLKERIKFLESQTNK